VRLKNRATLYVKPNTVNSPKTVAVTHPMLYLIWTLLNIALAVYFIILCFKAARLLKERIGLYAAVIFTLGLISFVGNSGKNRGSIGENPNVKKWNFVSRDNVVSGSLQSAHATIDKTWISEIQLMVLHGCDKSSNQTVPVEANSSWSGFVSGYDWEPTIISVHATTGREYKYTVIGILHWKLLGISLYSQHKTFSGPIELK
jgi:hypothetical protein